MLPSKEVAMQHRPSSLHWPQLLGALRTSDARFVRLRDGKTTSPAGDVRSRPAARGTELCLFSGTEPSEREALVRRLEALAKTGGRRFATAVRANIGDAFLLVESVSDEEEGGERFSTIVTRRPTLSYQQSAQTGSTSHLRSKRIKTG